MLLVLNAAVWCATGFAHRCNKCRCLHTWPQYSLGTTGCESRGCEGHCLHPGSQYGLSAASCTCRCGGHWCLRAGPQPNQNRSSTGQASVKPQELSKLSQPPVMHNFLHKTLAQEQCRTRPCHKKGLPRRHLATLSCQYVTMSANVGSDICFVRVCRHWRHLATCCRHLSRHLATLSRRYVAMSGPMSGPTFVL